MRKATFTLIADPNEAAYTIVVVDLETIGTIAVGNSLKPPYQGNHQKREHTKEKVKDKTNAQDLRERQQRGQNPRIEERSDSNDSTWKRNGNDSTWKKSDSTLSSREGQRWLNVDEN
ncbi:unnamed protein product [Prunus armeniaca]